MIDIITSPIDYQALTEQVRSRRAGAVCLFLGTTREITGEKQTSWLDYEAYAGMATQSLTRLEAESRRLWTLTDVAIVHRTGRVDLGEISVAIAVSAPHRADAFAACQWLMDQIKEAVPIWKRERWADGTEEWVHPGL